jgi:hypothetical protein
VRYSKQERLASVKYYSHTGRAMASDVSAEGIERGAPYLVRHHRRTIVPALVGLRIHIAVVASQVATLVNL